MLSGSGGLAQNFPPAMVSLRGPYYLLTQKDSNVFLQKGPIFSKKGPFLHDFEPVRHCCLEYFTISTMKCEASILNFIWGSYPPPKSPQFPPLPPVLHPDEKSQPVQATQKLKYNK